MAAAYRFGAGSSVWWAFSVDALRAGAVDVPGARAVYALTGAASLLGSFAGRLFGHLGLRRGYLVAVGLLSVSLAAFALMIEQVVGAALASAGFEAAYASVVAAYGVWSARVFPDHSTAGLAIANTALTVGAITGPAIAGCVIEQAGFRPTLLGAAGCLAVAVLFRPNLHPPRPLRH